MNDKVLRQPLNVIWTSILESLNEFRYEFGKVNFERNMAGIYCEWQWFAATVERKLQLWKKFKWNSVGLLLHGNAVCKLSKKIWTTKWKVCDTFSGNPMANWVQ